MKIEQGGIVITEVPGLQSIELRRDGITILRHSCLDDTDELQFFREEVVQLRDALNVIIEYADRAERPSMPEQKTTQPRSWKSGDDEPEGVTVVLDLDDDIWDRDGCGWSLRRVFVDNYSGWSWESLTREYGPLTEYRPAS